MRHQYLSLLAACLLLSGFLPDSGSAAPLSQVLNNSALVTQFNQMLQDSGLGAQMASGICSAIRCFLVFAPSNAAMQAAYAADPTGFSAIDKSTLVKHHYLSVFSGSTKGLLSAWSSAGTPVGADIGFGLVQILKTTSTTLYWLAKQGTDGSWSYRINNAAIDVANSNQEADNGVFHVLNQVALPVGTQQSVNVFFGATTAPIVSQLGIATSLKIFNEWMARDTVNSYLYNALMSGNAPYKVRTLFLPSDAAWARIPGAALQQLNSSLPDLRSVLVAHFAPDVCVFTTWMTLSSSISFNTGHADVQSFPAKMYMDASKKSFVSVGGVVAQFVDNAINYPIGDTVIHVVDRVLAYTPDTLATLAQTNAPGFYAKCMSVASCQAVLNDNTTQRTLFAPNDLSSLSSSTNATLVEQILLMHFVPTVIVKPDMTTSALLTAQNSVGQIRFRMMTNNTRYYVEGRLNGRGFVRSELLMYDQPAKNGIFHKVNYPIALPIQTVQDFINAYQDLSAVSSYMGSSSFDPNLGTAGMWYTVFPPNNVAMSAFASYKSSTGTTVGQTILASMTLANRVFRRIVLPNQKLVIDIAAAGITSYATANSAENEQLSLNLVGSAGLTTRTGTINAVNVQADVSVTNGEYECTNGMVYPVGVALYRDSDMSGYTRSASSLSSSMAVAVVTVLLVCLAYM